MLSPQTDKEECSPCKIVSEVMNTELPNLCKILGKDDKNCEKEFAKLRNGELTPEQVFGDYFDELDDTQVNAIYDWANDLKVKVDEKLKTNKDHS